MGQTVEEEDMKIWDRYEQGPLFPFFFPLSVPSRIQKFNES